MAKFKTVFTKQFKRFGKVTPARSSEYDAKIVPQQEITIRRNQPLEPGRLPEYRFNGERTFRVGDMAEYDSYNLHYFGRITSITNKTVTILDYPDSDGVRSRKHRLDLHTFCWRNFSRSVGEKRDKNADTRMYI